MSIIWCFYMSFYVERWTIVSLICATPTILRNWKIYNALAHILPEIGKVTCLTLKMSGTLILKVRLRLYKVCDSAIELPDRKTQETTKKFNALASILPEIGKVTCLTLKKCPWPWCRKSRVSCTRSVTVLLSCQTKKKIKKQTKLQCSSIYTSGDRRSHVSDFEKFSVTLM